jgi:hypothetical protein
MRMGHPPETPPFQTTLVRRRDYPRGTTSTGVRSCNCQRSPHISMADSAVPSFTARLRKCR